MKEEVHVFLAEASALDGNVSGYPKGERHAMLVFLNQNENTEHDWENAENIIKEAKWNDIEISKAGTLSSEGLNGKDQKFIDSYESALFKGSAILIYTGKDK